MSKTFFIQGCSHCSGAELPGDNGKGLVYDLSWPNQLAKNLGASEVVNRAAPGSSNTWIAKDTINYVSKNLHKDLFVIIGFTGADRIYLKHLAYQNNKPHGRVILTPGVVDNKDFADKELLPEHHDMYKTLLLTEWGEWNQIQLRFMQEVLYLKTFLDDHAVPYLFVTTIFPFDEKYRKAYEYKWLLDKLNSKRLYGGFKPESVYYNILKDKFHINEKFHIGEEGQRYFAELMQEYITLNDLLLH